MTEQLVMLIELYKFYLELIVQSGVLAGAVVGGLLGYLAKQERLLLLLKMRIIPSLISFTFSVIYAITIWPSIELAGAIKIMGKAENLCLVPHAWLLPTAVIFFFIVFFSVSLFIFLLPRFSNSEKI